MMHRAPTGVRANGPRHALAAWRGLRFARSVLVVALAYMLALGGVLGAMGAGPHAAEARTAAQLGVICTIHGMALPRHGGPDSDPTPGKLACIEHCTLASSAPAPALPVLIADLFTPEPDRSEPAPIAVELVPGGSFSCIPPPPRGPPALI